MVQISEVCATGEGHASPLAKGRIGAIHSAPMGIAEDKDEVPLRVRSSQLRSRYTYWRLAKRRRSLGADRGRRDTQTPAAPLASTG